MGRSALILRFMLATLATAGSVSPAIGQAFFNTGGGTFSTEVTSLRDMPFRTVVRQQYDYSCGSAALATILKHHYGRPISEAEVFRAMYAAGDQEKIRKVGFSLLDMKSYLATLGLKSEGYRQSLKDLERAQAPAIALIKVANYRHFVVVKGVRNGQVLVGDPNEGLKLYSLAEFGQVWGGVVFVIRPSQASSAPGQGVFNREQEWASLTYGPVNRLDDRSLSSLTRALPPIYQILAARNETGAGR